MTKVILFDSLLQETLDNVLYVLDLEKALIVTGGETCRYYAMINKHIQSLHLKIFIYICLLVYILPTRLRAD